MAKGVASGYAPISCTVTTEKVFQDFVNDPADTDAYFRDISTFGGCTSGPAAALANIEIIERENLLENCTKMGDRLLEGLKGLMAKHPIIGDVRGKGLFAGIEIVKDRATKEPIAEAVANAMVGAAKQAGVLIGKTSRSFREFNNTLTLCPALIATEADIDEIVARYRQGVHHRRTEVRSVRIEKPDAFIRRHRDFDSRKSSAGQGSALSCFGI